MSASTPDLTKAQLFIDDTWIAESIRVQRTFHEGRKFKHPVITPDKPWERWGCVGYGSALYWRGKFHIWYITWTRPASLKICYACSDDGSAFEKPNLGIYEFEGSKDNNICLMTDEPGVIDCVGIIDDPEDEEWPLKAIYWRRFFADPHPAGGGLVACRSKDGIHWDKTPGMVLPKWGDRTNAFATKVDGKYVVLGRAPERGRYECRCVWRTESEDLVNWSKPVRMMKPDIEDDARTEIYSTQAFEYESLYMGFIERMHMVPDKLDSQLIYSHDSRAWQRTRQRPTFIPWGVRGSWDDTWVSMMSNGPILSHNNLWFYYSGRGGAHAAPHPHTYSAVGLATLRPDGFVSLQAKDREGWVVTPPMTWPDLDLLVNVDARRDLTSHPSYCSGECRVEVLDEGEQPIEGYSRNDCVAIHNNTFRSPMARQFVAWSGEKRMPSLAGRKVRLKFYLRDAHLYSFLAGEMPG